MKHCSKCGLNKPLSEFSRDRSQRSSHHPSCKTCVKARYDKDGHGKALARQNYWKYPEKYRAQAREFRLAHPGYARIASAKHYLEHHARCLEASANTRQRYTDDAFVAYGGFRCVCCGETNPKFLTIDHINNCTRNERKEQRTGWLFCQWLKKQGYPTGYQVLCFNCNCGRARNHGICPHKQ